MSKYSKLNWLLNKGLSNEGYRQEWFLKSIDFKRYPILPEIYLDGYWQEGSLFNNISNELREEFTPKERLSLSREKYKNEINNCINPVSLHIRKTDYLLNKNAKIFSNISPNYYNNAMEFLNQKVESPHYFIFADDFNWVKSNLKLPTSHTLVLKDAVSNDYEDLLLMSLCKHNIIANSTFSWWGAWLNSYNTKFVLFPEKWFVNKATNLGLPEWVSIPL